MAAASAGPRNDLNLDKFRKLLQGERDRVMSELRRLDASEETGGTAGETGELADYDQHDADQATELFLRERDEAMIVQLRSELEQVDLAVERLDEGTFGYCERCGKPIPKERLEALPFTRHDVQCASEIESRF
jgi:RNA polymerase-binding transcription factor DksA